MDALVNTFQTAAVGLLVPQKVFLLFNKASGTFISWAGWHEPHGIDPTLFDIAVQEDFSESTQKVIGKYPDYQVVEIADMPQQVGEGYIDGMTVTEITTKYPLERQVNNIADALLAVIAHVGATGPAVEALQDQVAEIKEIIAVGKLRKQGYASDDSFEYVSTAQAAELEASKYEGGLGEVIGPRQVSAVR